MAAARESPDRTGSVRQPRSAFTIVRVRETLADVALRVYGQSDDSDLLWRANRDALPHRDSPLAPGMMLRTPSAR